MLPTPPRSTLFPYTTLFRSVFGSERGNPTDTESSAPVSAPQISEADASPAGTGPRNYPTGRGLWRHQFRRDSGADRSEEHTSELQSRLHLVCRLLLETKKAS